MYTFCPRCATKLQTEARGGRDRRVCPNCDWVHWDNPVPVVAAIAERDGQLFLVRSIGWPAGWFGLVTGFLERGEMPEEGVIREVREELGLDAELGKFVGMYPFHRMNQLLIVYHVRVGPGEVTLDETELEAYKVVPVEKVQPWPMGTGVGLRDWLRSRGYEREFMKFGD